MLGARYRISLLVTLVLVLAAPARGAQVENMVFDSIDVRAALKLVADQGGLNLVIGDAVGGDITVDLRDTTWNEALSAIARASGLHVSVVGNVITVLSERRLLERELRLLEQRALIKKLREETDPGEQARWGFGLGDSLQFTGERLSMNFQDIETRAILELIADFTGLNLVASDSVTGPVTLRLKNVPWDQALHIILSEEDLTMSQQGNVMVVARPEEFVAREIATLGLQQLDLELSGLRAALQPIGNVTPAIVSLSISAEFECTRRCRLLPRLPAKI